MLISAEHKLPGAERTKLPNTVDQDDIEEAKTAHVCYFIVGGDEFSNFNLDSMSHELMVSVCYNNIPRIVTIFRLKNVYYLTLLNYTNLI